MRKKKTNFGNLSEFPVPNEWKWISKFEPQKGITQKHPPHKRWMRRHQETHDCREIMVCLSGRHFYGYRDEVRDVAPGTIILIDAGEPHDAMYSQFQPSCRDLWFHLSTPSVFFVNDVTVSTSKRKVTSNQVMYSTGYGKPYSEVVAITWNRCNEHPDSIFHFAQLKAAIGAMVMEVILNSSEFSRSPVVVSQQQMIVDRIKGYILGHLDADLSLNTLADMAGYEPIYFHRLFKKFIGEPIHHFVNRYRLISAKAKLREGSRIEPIAFELGFSSSAYFCRFFKRETGLTPSAWLQRQD